MIILDDIVDKITVSLGEAATTQLPCYASYVEVTTSSYTPASNATTTNNTTSVTLVNVPSASAQRQVKLITINNIDNITHNVTIYYNVSSVDKQLFKVQLLINEKLCYTDGEGWRVYDSSGNLKNNFATGISAFSAGTNLISSGQAVLSNSNNFSVGANNNVITASISNSISFSSYQNTLINLASNMPVNATVNLVQFNLPANLSYGYIRIPCGMSTNSTSLTATVGPANVSIALYSSVNCAIYTQATGSNSSILSTIAKGSVGWTQINSISCATNSSQFSHSQTISGWARTGVTSFTTQYSVSNLNSQLYSTNTYATLFSAQRYIDIPIQSGVSTLSPGYYWFAFGVSTTTDCNSTAAFSAASNCHVRLGSFYAISQPALSFAPMGATNRSSAIFGAGSVSCVQLQDTIAISAISTQAGLMAFQLLGSNQMI
jgi:hypothetical protein